MSIYKCECKLCHHYFYSLQVECRALYVINCPLCKGGVVVDDVEVPSDRAWGECKKSGGGNCSDCSNKCKS